MDTLFLALRVAVALAAVLGLIWFVQRKLNNKGSGKKAGGGIAARLRTKRPIQVVGSHRLAPKASIAVVEIEGQKLVLGVTEHGISVLESAVPVTVADVEREDEIIEPAPAPLVPAQTFVAPQGPVRAPVAAPTPDFAAALRAAEMEALEPTVDRSTLGTVITEGLRPTELALGHRRSRGRLGVPDLDANRAAATRPAARLAIPAYSEIARPAPLATPALAAPAPASAPTIPSFATIPAQAVPSAAAATAIETHPAVIATMAADPAPASPSSVTEPAAPRPARTNPSFLEALRPAFQQVLANTLGTPAPVTKSPIPAATARNDYDLKTAVPFASKLPVLRRAS